MLRTGGLCGAGTRGIGNLGQICALLLLRFYYRRGIFYYFLKMTEYIEVP